MDDLDSALLRLITQLESKSLASHPHVGSQRRKRTDTINLTYIQKNKALSFTAQKYRTKLALNRINGLINQFRDELTKLYDTFVVDPYDNLSKAVNNSRQLFRTYYQKAFQIGHAASNTGTTSIQIKPLDASDRQWIGTAVAEELKYWRRFLRDVQTKDSYHASDIRIRWFARTLYSVFYAGQVVNIPAQHTIFWVVDPAAESCTGCLWLRSQSPWTKENLPTTPRAGDCQCYANCRCSLRFVLVSAEEYQKVNAKHNRSAAAAVLKGMK